MDLFIRATPTSATPSFFSLAGAFCKRRLFPFLFLLLSYANLQAQCSIVLTPVNISEPSCGGNEGFFQVQVTGITAPYQYVLYKEVNGNFELQENGTLIAGTLTFVGLTGGTYKVYVNKDGCSSEVIVPLPSATLSLTPTNINHPSCGGNEGFFQVQATGITAPYQYVLYKEVNGNFELQENGTLIAGTFTFVGLTGGKYKVSVAKGGTCSGEVEVTLTPETLTLTPTNINHSSCGDNDGFFQVQATGITAPYQYVLYKEVNGNFELQENGTLIAGTLTFVGLTGGKYKVSVAKGGTCSGEVEVTLTPETLTLTPTNINHPSCGGNDGFFQVQATGITAPYQYILYKEVNGNFELQENGTLIAGTLTFVGLTGGNYKVSVSKGGTCSGEVEVTLTPDPLNLVISGLTPPACEGNTGSFQIQASGIIPPYQYVLSKEINGNFVSQENGTLISGNLNFVSLSPGIYKVEVSNAGMCSGEIIVYMFCEMIGTDGCGSGYWKNNPSAWQMFNYSPVQTLESIFNVPDIFGLDDVSLMQVLDNTNGTALNSASGNLLRAATTALLNAGHPDVDYPLTSQQIINNTNTALATLNNKTISNLTKTLDKYNNRYCPLNAVPVNPSITVQEDPLTVIVSELQVKAFPNPSSGLYNIQIESTLKDKISVRVIDVQGRLVDQHQNVQPNQILRIGENYVPGIYFLQVEQGDQRKQLKLIKMK